MFGRNLSIAALLGFAMANSARMDFPHSFSGPSESGPRKPGPGWAAAHVKRLARKKRNQARHKRAVRG